MYMDDLQKKLGSDRDFKNSQFKEQMNRDINRFKNSLDNQNFGSGEGWESHGSHNYAFKSGVGTQEGSKQKNASFREKLMQRLGHAELSESKQNMSSGNEEYEGSPGGIIEEGQSDDYSGQEMI
eukprot:CAMPEP_0170544428 /NCGR_PEP_ID=MMETSP0211-20121228/3192_1 /TAXON_ID=311385 /ORGANISM="Pseudokeronopsis sp., Strain OXSARD2" /LENGTH=123 /DNA_ID=CAMNT_0010848075 /DNA_START=2739 /DNA_END=3110 /DNA_ORIENTATION=-